MDIYETNHAQYATVIINEGQRMCNVRRCRIYEKRAKTRI